MGIIDEAVLARDAITNHSHYGTCLNGSRYRNFDEKRNQLNKSLEYRTKAFQLKEAIIEENNNLKIKETAYNQNKDLDEHKYELLKKEKEQEEIELIQNNEKILEKEKNNKDFEIKKLENELEQLKIDISNLENEIKFLKELNEEEIKRKKEAILNKFQNEYELKLDRYKREKELEQFQKEEDIKYKKMQFEMKKRKELTDLRYKADTVNKLIFIFSQNKLFINH